MQIYFKTRSAARVATFGKLVDNGKDAILGKRYARDISKPAKQAGFTLFELVFVILWLSVLIGGGYVIIHFISKFW